MLNTGLNSSTEKSNSLFKLPEDEFFNRDFRRSNSPEPKVFIPNKQPIQDFDSELLAIYGKGFNEKFISFSAEAFKDKRILKTFWSTFVTLRFDLKTFKREEKIEVPAFCKMFEDLFKEKLHLFLNEEHGKFLFEEFRRLEIAFKEKLLRQNSNLNFDKVEINFFKIASDFEKELVALHINFSEFKDEVIMLSLPKTETYTIEKVLTKNLF